MIQAASRAFQIEEDAAIWTRSWVCVGFAADIPGAGDILPFTVGDHGVHVERQDDGSLLGRFNKAQHGGCRAVPVQCQTGTKTRCSFTACGYSRDRGPIAADAPDRGTSLDQYLGLRPERLLAVALKTWGPLILAQLDPAAAAPFAWPDPPILVPDLTPKTHWVHAPANWKTLAGWLANGDLLATGADHAATGDAVVLFPNVVILTRRDWSAVVVLQPIALDQTLCRIRTFGPDAEGHELALLGTIDAIGRDAPQDDACQDQDKSKTMTRWFGDKVYDAVVALQDMQRTDPLYRTADKGGW